MIIRTLLAFASTFLLSAFGANLAAAAATAATASTGAAAADDSDAILAAIQPDAIRADLRFLSDDLLEGRGIGSRGHQLAAQFIASQLESLGLSPAGDRGTYF